MGFDAAWARAANTIFAVMGLPATIRRKPPNDTPLASEVIWISATAPVQPFGVDLVHVDSKRIAVFARTDALPDLPRGTVVEAAELEGGAVKTWRVDGYAAPVSSDEIRVFMVER